MDTKKVLLVVFFLLPFSVPAQDKRVIDSIMPLIKNDGSLNDMEIFYELGYQYATTNRSLSIQYLDSGLVIASGIGDSLKIVKMNRMKAQVLRREGRQAEAILILEKILPIAKRLNYTTEMGYIYTSLANTQTFMAHFDIALEFNFRALETWRALDDKDQIVGSLNNIGLVHYKVGNFDKAIDYYLKALSVAEQITNYSVPQSIYSNLGLANLNNKDTVTAKIWFEKLVLSCSPECSKLSYWEIQYGLGYVALYGSDFLRAKKHFINAYKLALELGDPLDIAESLFKQGEASRRLQEFQLAESVLLEALTICRRNKYRLASQSIKSTIASQRGLNTAVVVQSESIDSVHAQKLEDELNRVAESLVKARSVQTSMVRKT